MLGFFGGIFLFLVPGGPRDFMEENAVLGWAGFAFVLFMYRPLALWFMKSAEMGRQKHWGKLVTQLTEHWSGVETRVTDEYARKLATLADEYARKEATLVDEHARKEATLADEHARKEATLADEHASKMSELARINSEKDVPLLNERLQTMSMNGDFHTYLAESVDHKSLVFGFIKTLEDQLLIWDRDTRVFSDPDFTAAWEEFARSAKGYTDKTNEYMWMKDDSDILHVPPEWKDNDPKRYRKAFEELDTARRALFVSLGALYRLQHSKATGTPASASAMPRGMATNNLLSPPPPPNRM